MEGVVRAVRSGLVWPPFDPAAAARYYDFMPYILHLPWKEEVLVDAPKRSVYQLSLWLSCHAPPLCRLSVPGPQYARTSPKRCSPNFALKVFSEVAPDVVSLHTRLSCVTHTSGLRSLAI